MQIFLLSIKEGDFIIIQFKLSKIFKVIDAFSNKIIEDAFINVIGENVTVLNKKNGFYIFFNLDVKEYVAEVSCRGYKTRNITFTPNDEDESAELIMLVPSDENKMKTIKGTLKDGRKKLALKNFYYAICVKDFSVTISGKYQKDNDFIKVHSYEKLSLEGRMFVIESDEKSVITLGNYDFIGKKYKTKNTISNDIMVGETAFLLFEGKTDQNSAFEISVPKTFLDDKFEMIFIINEKSSKIEFDNKKNSDIKVVVKG